MPELLLPLHGLIFCNIDFLASVLYITEVVLWKGDSIREWGICDLLRNVRRNLWKESMEGRRTASRSSDLLAVRMGN